MQSHAGLLRGGTSPDDAAGSDAERTNESISDEEFLLDDEAAHIQAETVTVHDGSLFVTANVTALGPVGVDSTEGSEERSSRSRAAGNKASAQRFPLGHRHGCCCWLRDSLVHGAAVQCDNGMHVWRHRRALA